LSESTEVVLGILVPIPDRPDLRRIERVRFTITASSFFDGLADQRYIIFQNGRIVDGAVVRLVSACFGQAVGLLRCDCQDQLNLALSFIGKTPNSLLIYAFDQDGRGNGPLQHVNAIKQMDEFGVPLRDAYPMGDRRKYEDTAVLLKDVLGLTSIRLLTNSPLRVQQLQMAGLKVEQLTLEPSVRDEDRKVLEWKRDLEGHTLVLDGLSHVG
jgi:GTP cyclohydrolase II